jgi:hypothetical protein
VTPNIVIQSADRCRCQKAHRRSAAGGGAALICGCHPTGVGWLPCRLKTAPIENAVGQAALHLLFRFISPIWLAI